MSQSHPMQRLISVVIFGPEEEFGLRLARQLGKVDGKNIFWFCVGAGVIPPF